MKRIKILAIVVFLLLSASCSKQSSEQRTIPQGASAPRAEAPSPFPASTPPSDSAQQSIATPQAVASPAPLPVGAETVSPAPEPTPAATPPSETQAPVTPPALEPARVSTAAPAEPGPAGSSPSGRVEVGATKPGLTRVGADMCKLCHKLQYESWSASAHARRNPPLDCESCHGPGSEYKSISVMKDVGKAEAAGLVIPTRAFCTDNCHRTGWQDDMLGRAHTHKQK